jgi:hypothetical protein
MKKKQRKPGTVPPGKIGVYDRAGNLRGHVGNKATSVTAARFTGQAGATLTKGKSKGERDSWSFPK